jgi:hypothetical protein
MVVTLAFFGLAANVGPVRAYDAATQEEKRSAVAQTGSKRAYLGLEIEPLPEALSSQLAGIVPQGQGILVGRIPGDSPAKKAGLLPHDILLSYGDQKLYSPEQLIKLVRSDEPGREVTVAFVRHGQNETRTVTLGARDVSSELDQSRVFRLRPDERLRRMFDESELRRDHPAWTSFDALKLTRLDSQRWRAEIEYRNKEGKPEKKTFEGTRDELRKDLLAEKDLPENERNHLLRALNLHEPVFEFHFPPIGPLVPGL